VKARTATALTASIAFAIVALASLGPVHYWPDSGGYINNELRRTWLYPAFIDWINPNQPWISTPEEAQEHYLNVVVGQHFLAIGAFAFLMFSLAGFGRTTPWIVALGSPLVDRALSLGLAGDLFHHLSAILTEGLLYPWLMVLLGLAARMKAPDGTGRSIGMFLFFGFWCYLAIEITPRALAFAAFALMPLTGRADIGTGLGWLGRAAPAAVVAILFVLRCSMTYLDYGAFSPAPYDGYGLIGMALQFSKPGDERVVRDPRVRSFVAAALKDPRRGQAGEHGFVTNNIWTVAGPHFSDEFGGSVYADHPRANRVLSEAARALLFGVPENLRAWLSWSAGEVVRYLRDRWPLTATALLCWAYWARGVLRRKGPSAPEEDNGVARASRLASVAAAVFFANPAITITLQDREFRYLAGSEILLLASALSLLGAVIGGSRSHQKTAG